MSRTSLFHILLLVLFSYPLAASAETVGTGSPTTSSTSTESVGNGDQSLLDWFLALLEDGDE